MEYTSPYIWPNPAFPFREYYDGPECRIFIIENIHHNWEWFRDYHTKFRDNDVFLVYCGWYFDEYFAKQANIIFDGLSMKRENFFMMFNSELEMKNFEGTGLPGDVINHNCWLDPSSFGILPDVEKVYDAIYTARLSPFKRHELAVKVPNLALVAGIDHGNTSDKPLPPHAYRNERILTPDEVCEKINQSHCGLLLSESEGACFSSSEYLISGVPVVSTKCFGGRDVWYNDYNSIVCEPDPDAIRDAVAFFKENPRDPRRIRQDHIDLAQIHRARFVKALGDIFARFGVGKDAQSFFDENYMHKMRRSYKPDFDAIFG